MDLEEQQNRETTFLAELERLKKGGYITNEDYTFIKDSYAQYAIDLAEQEEEDEIGDLGSDPYEMEHEVESTPEESQPIMQATKTTVEKSPEQIRERNITWSLILGVIMLLISGLVVATSTWDQIGPLLKVSLISFVSVFFLGLSWVTGKLLNIKQTAFAFLTLGSLFVPITVLSIGYFELFGPYLSLTGEGKELMGLFGALLSLPLYIRNAAIHQSRLFIWLSYLFSTVAVGFALAALHVSIDFFYLGIMLYNALLLFLYHTYRSLPKFNLFTRELPAYAQLNLVISTLLMLFFYENSIFYSFNLLLTAVLYMSMVFVYNTKEYQFVFSALLAYSAYQFIENIPVGDFSLILFALVGFVYIGLQWVMRNHSFQQKMFQYASGIISFFAFIYISIEGLLVTANEASVVLLIAYILITLNYGFLAYLTKRELFSYLSSIFLVIAGLESWNVIRGDLGGYVASYMFGFALLMFFGLYHYNYNKYTLPIKVSSFYIAIATMVLSIISTVGTYPFTYELAILPILFGGFMIIVNRTVYLPGIKELAHWMHPISIGIGIMALYPLFIADFIWYEEQIVLHTFGTAILLLALSYIWKKSNKSFEETSFILAQLTYTVSLLMVLSFNFQLNEEYARPFIFLIGILFYYLLARRQKELPTICTLVSLTTLGFYLSLIVTFELETLKSITVYLLFAPILLMSIAEVVGRKITALRPHFYWLSHIIQPVIVLGAIVVCALAQVLSATYLFIPLGFYLYSAIQVKPGLLKQIYLYIALTFIPILLGVYGMQYEVFNVIQEGYVFVISSIVMFALYFVTKGFWKEKIDWYSTIFTVIGLWVFVLHETSLRIFEVGVVIPYLALVLWTFHRRKWTVFNGVPLIVTYFMWVEISAQLTEITMLLLSLGSFFVLILLGRVFHTFVYERTSTLLKLDWYSIVGVGYLLYAYNWINDDATVWVKIIPVLLLSFFTFTLLNRVQDSFVQKVILSVGTIVLFIPYYMILNEYQTYIPALLEAEIYALPWIGVTVGLSMKIWREYRKQVDYVQLAVLLVVTTYLTIDALQSNTIWDALIMGSLAVISILVGMQYRIKSYFFVGVGVLLLNVFLQTKPYWGNLPWWVYLLIGGSTLITAASYNEWQKQKHDQDGRDLLQNKIKRLLRSFKEWN